jgi:hypothetical protein
MSATRGISTEKANRGDELRVLLGSYELTLREDKLNKISPLNIVKAVAVQYAVIEGAVVKGESHPLSENV